MVAGHLREKSGYYYAVLNYTDSLGKRKTNWFKNTKITHVIETKKSIYCAPEPMCRRISISYGHIRRKC